MQSDKINSLKLPADLPVHRFSHYAMATVYEVIIEHNDRDYAEQAATECFSELDRLEDELSRYRENTDIARIATLKDGDILLLGEDTFTCLAACQQIHQLTHGVFDISLGPLVDIYKYPDKSPRTPAADEVAAALRHTGMQRFILDPDEISITVSGNASLQLDLGGYGKGYALEKLAELLAEWELEQALVHGGMSTALALAPPTGLEGWPVSISHPGSGKLLLQEQICHQAISGSGMAKGYHILDPRSGQPAARQRTTWTCVPDAGLADALSTAFMLLNDDEILAVCKNIDGARAYVLDPDGELRELG